MVGWHNVVYFSAGILGIFLFIQGLQERRQSEEQGNTRKRKFVMKPGKEQFVF